jgi:hypothetical protein
VHSRARGRWHCWGAARGQLRGSCSAAGAHLAERAMESSGAARSRDQSDTASGIGRCARWRWEGVHYD